MFRALFLICVAALISPAMADERSAAQEQLEQVNKDVAELKKLMQKLQKEKSGAQQDLQKTETEMGTLEKQVKELQQELKGTESELKRLDEEKKKLQSARTEQQKLIAIQVRAAYQSGEQEPLRLLLNQQQPEKFSRSLTYYEYLGKARLEQLATFNETLRQLDNVELAIVTQQTQLTAQKAELDQQREQLSGLRQERRKTLAKLNQEYSARDRKLKARQQEQAELAKVLKTIEETLARQAREAEHQHLPDQSRVRDVDALGRAAAFRVEVQRRVGDHLARHAHLSASHQASAGAPGAEALAEQQVIQVCHVCPSAVGYAGRSPAGMRVRLGRPGAGPA